MTVVIAGLTNVGKSSLLNALSGEETAIVTDVAGTTRDVLHEHISLDGIPLHIIDTAGMRNTDDIVEQEGINRAHRATQSADHVLVLTDAERLTLPEMDLPAHIPATLVINKVDLNDSIDASTLIRNAKSACSQFSALEEPAILSVSAKTGAGLDALRQHLLALVGHDAHLEGTFIARRRHLDALTTAQAASAAALQRLESGYMPELAAEEFRQAQLALDGVTGKFDSEDLLGEIFGSFCIGK